MPNEEKMPQERQTAAAVSNRWTQTGRRKEEKKQTNKNIAYK